MNEMEMSKQEFLKRIKTRREAEQYLGLSQVAMQYHLRQGNITPCKEVGSGTGKVQLFWESDLDELKKLLK